MLKRPLSNASVSAVLAKHPSSNEFSVVWRTDADNSLLKTDTLVSVVSLFIVNPEDRVRE